MEQQQLDLSRGRSASATSAGADHQHHIRHGHSPSPAGFPDAVANPVHDSTSLNGIGLGIASSQQQYQQDFQFNPSNSFLSGQQAQSSVAGAYDLNQDFSQQLKSEDNCFAEAQGSFSQALLSSNFGDADFTIFPPSSEDQFNAPLFAGDNQQLVGADDNIPNNNMASLDMHPGSARQSPSLSSSFQNQSFSPPVGHLRNGSLGPEAALLPGRYDWSNAGPQFQGHRRNPSDISDVSSAGASPNLSVADGFDFDHQGHSPMHRAQDAGMFADLQGISNFSISDQGAYSPNHQNGRSPSHSPAMSPRIPPEQMPDMQHQQPQNYLLQSHLNASYGPPVSYPMQTSEAFPSLPQSGADMQVPNIQVDYAPTHGVDQPNKSALDADSLTPPDRGRPKQRQRAVTDPRSIPNRGHNRTTSGTTSLSPNPAGFRSESSHSLTPLERSGSGAASLSPSPSRQRRQSTSAVPNNLIALRLADREGFGAGGHEGPGATTGRVQKHPATFQCDKCPKKFTRAYNLRSHLRTHTNERPFVCSVCKKAFARQHDRKRHEGLHSGEKKFVCRGVIPSTGAAWGCGRKFARADALGRHFRSEAGRICIKPLLDYDMQQRHMEQQQQMQQAAAQGMAMQPSMGMMMPPGIDPNPYSLDGATAFPQALLSQFPFLATTQWGDMGGGGSGVEDDLSGRSNFEGSDFEDDGGYASGPGTGFGAGGPGGMGENFSDMGGYASDYGPP